MRDIVRLSKFVSYVLRHGPEEAGVSIDKEGWVDVDALIAAARQKGFSLDNPGLKALEATSDKKRFTLSEDGTRIRAAQGHSSAQVNISFVTCSPPATLYHGTAKANVGSILERGILPGKRQYVHLSLDERTALSVGRRHGKPVVFAVNSSAMYQAGINFYQADNGVWLTRFVDREFLKLQDNA